MRFSLPATNERRNIYILDDPSLIDNISVAHRRRLSSSWGPKYRDELIEAMLNRMEDLRSDIYDDLAGSVVAQEKMQEVLSVFDNAFHAVLAPSPSGLVINTDEKVKNPIQAGNASMGVKAFAIIRFLIENGSFQMMTYSFWMNRKSTCILNGRSRTRTHWCLRPKH